MSDDTGTVVRGPSVEREEVTEAELRELGVDLSRDFPGSTAADFRRYPVLTEGGWFMVVKHQQTLRSVSREPWHLLGPITLLSDGLSVD
ncbi:MAG: hypothetical protein GEV10_10200 [Streptosporangiales bacterium]|nr:hypothetical protein [Streptosporangiales bacterium]